MAEVQISKGIANEDGRRFSILIEGVTPVLSGDGVVASGNVNGTVKTGDHVYILYPNGMHEGTVKGLEAMVEDKLSITEEATDTRVNIQLEVADPSDIRLMMLITSVHPVEKFDPAIPMENPYLAGLLYEAEKHKEDKSFVSIMSFLLAHANFITPMQVQPLEDGKTKMGFFMLPAQKPEEGKMPSKFYFPVFTDFEALSKWTALTKQGNKVPTTIMTFKNVVDAIKPEPVVGFIVNPFNKNMVIATDALVQSILNSDGYKRDFGVKEEA